MRFSKCLIMALAFSFFWGCTDTKRSSAEESARPDVITQVPPAVVQENDLFLHSLIKPGMRFEDIDSIFPHKELELVAEIFGDNYQEASMPYKIMNTEGYINFNFQDSVMYSFYYELDSIGQEEGDSVYNNLKVLYRQEFSDLMEEEVVEEGDQYTFSTYWKRPDFEYVITFNVNSKFLSWGMQERK